MAVDTRIEWADDIDPTYMHRTAADQGCCGGRSVAAFRGAVLVYRDLLRCWYIAFRKGPDCSITHCPWCGTRLPDPHPLEAGDGSP